MKKFLTVALIAAMLCSRAAFAEKEEAETVTAAESVTEVAENSAGENDEKYTLPKEEDEAELPEGAVECAEDTEEPTVIGGADAETEISVQDIHILTVNVTMTPKMKVVDSVAVFELCDKDGKVIGTKEEWIGGITETLELKFDVPVLKAGDTYKLRLKSGLNYLKYYDKTYGTGEEIELVAYGYRDENDEPCVASDFAVEGCPLYEHAIVTYVERVQLQLYPDARLIDSTAMVPVRPVAEALGLDVRYDERYNSIVCEIAGKQAIFNVGTAYATIMGTDIYLPASCQIIDDTAFVPARTLAEAFGCSVEALDFGDHIDVCIGESSVVKEYRMSVPVNQWGISSRTNYMVWIDKSDFRVRVYKGSKGKWEEVKSFACAIGAPGSPTITGSYEYEYRMPQWSYPGYYVGPCLVFYGNYAMHSTLLQYNGTPYDDRVGVMISHGCVRLRKADIDWLDRNLPVKSRVYITE